MIEDQHGGFPLDLTGLRRFLAQLRRQLGIRGQIGVRLVDAAAIRRLNRDFLGHDHPTDVLSFPAAPPPPGTKALLYLGDLAVCLDVAAAAARTHGHPLDAEVRILLLHGVLHLAGYDHASDQGEMRNRERELRLACGLPPELPGLIERAAGRRISS